LWVRKEGLTSHELSVGPEIWKYRSVLFVSCGILSEKMMLPSCDLKEAHVVVDTAETVEKSRAAMD
jgi:hypothetical protein